MDTNYLSSIIDKFENVITVEEGVKTGGFGESVASWLITHRYKGSVDIISLPDEFVEHGPRDMLLEKWGVNQNGIEKTVINKDNPVKVKY
jgi:1-deoxy-D-xylulose-5-phosphate synthase